MQRLLSTEARLLARLRTEARRAFAPVTRDADVQPAVDSLVLAFNQAILDGRLQAKQQAAAQVAEELDTDPEAVSLNDEDVARARSVSHSSVGALALGAMLLLRTKKQPVFIVSLDDYRLRRIAGTEVPNAFSRQHYTAQQLDGWARRWDATLDAKVCETCKSMHGITVPAYEAFPKGLVPGDVHPLCRCFPTYVPLSMLKAA